MPGFLAEITPVVLTRDEEVNIGRTLGQLRWAREVIVVDSESTDRTRQIAASFPNVRVTIRRFDDFAGQWNHAMSMITTAWMLALDAAGKVRKLWVVAPLAVALHTLFAKRSILDGRAGWRYALERFLAELILSLELTRPRTG